MATKADFTPEEWQSIEFAVADTLTYASMAHPGFWEMFKEGTASAKFMADQRNAPNLLVRDIATNMKPKADEALKANPTAMADTTVDKIKAAVVLLQTKAPDDVQPFKDMLLGLADAVVEAAGGIDDAEYSAIDKIKEALA